MWMGRAFQREGAATEKALSPQVPSLVLGTDKQFVSAQVQCRTHEKSNSVFNHFVNLCLTVDEAQHVYYR